MRSILVRTASVFIALMTFGAPSAFASDELSGPAVRLSLSLVDAPFNTEHGGRWPSMRQSLDLSTSLYEVLDGSLHATTRAFSLSRPRLVATIISGALDALVLPYVPGFWAWNHEEFHRAVLSRRGFNSQNSVNRFPFGEEFLPVDHVKDADLIALKASHPAEMARLSSAGMEGTSNM